MSTADANDATAAQPLRWASVAVGDDVPRLVKRPSPMQLFMFSAVTWNRHLIHYDREFAVNDGLPNIAVHRALIGGFLAQMLSDWVSFSGVVVLLEWSVRRSAVIGEPLICLGTVTDKRADGDARLVDCRIVAVAASGDELAPGRATVRLDE